jgi:hypothetical protein
MKRALAGVLVAAIVGLSAGGALADAQPFIQVYFDDGSNGSFGEGQAVCGQAGLPVYLYVVAKNFDSWTAAVEYKIDIPDGIMYFGETFEPNPLGGGMVTYGNSQVGLTISWSLPNSAFGSKGLLISTVLGVWTADCYCQTGPQPIVVGAYPYPVPKTQPSFVRWPDLVEFSAVGMTSLLCPGPVSTTESTWGGIKALYR